MLRLCRLRLSTTLHESNPFVDGVLQLIKLHLAHKNAWEDGNLKAGKAIEHEFLKEVEAFRPCFSMCATLSVASQYSKRLYGALRYFGLEDDPLMRQLELVMGKQSMREESSKGGSGSIFKGAKNVHSSNSAKTGNRRRESQSEYIATIDPLGESVATIFPDELPHPPQINPTESLREGAILVKDRYRGHWVLREPDIAITRTERREDPW